MTVRWDDLPSRARARVAGGGAAGAVRRARPPAGPAATAVCVACGTRGRYRQIERHVDEVHGGGTILLEWQP